MPPARVKKQTVSASSTEAISSFPAPPTMLPTKASTPIGTPERSPSKRAVGITQAQKQALIDNLQLEVTERARKLRAQYALQAQGLRARLEMRVNRIPQALRMTNIKQLVEKHSEQPKPEPPSRAIDAPVRHPDVIVSPPKERTLKRTSDALDQADDKENAPTPDLPNPKKRSKMTTAKTGPARAISRKGAPPSVLSPKSHNSRTLPRSPFKSPEKRPLSPIKPAVSHISAQAKAPSRAPSRQTKRTAPPSSQATEAEGRESEASNTSAGTTIVTKPGTKPGTKKTAPAKKGMVSRAIAGLGSKGRAAKKENVPPPAASTGGRVLRKRA